jgi:hypothetical protein
MIFKFEDVERRHPHCFEYLTTPPSIFRLREVALQQVSTKKRRV